jgi:carbon storage regulator
MLVLSRHVNEEILIADNIRIVIVRLKGSIVRIGIEAPADITVRRAELADRPIEEVACVE